MTDGSGFCTIRIVVLLYFVLCTFRVDKSEIHAINACNSAIIHSFFSARKAMVVCKERGRDRMLCASVASKDPVYHHFYFN